MHYKTPPHRGFYRAFFRCALYAMVFLALPAAPVTAQTPGTTQNPPDSTQNTPPIFVPPEPAPAFNPLPAIKRAGVLSQIMTPFSDELDKNIRTLQDNLDKLSLINSEANRAALDNLGQNYGNAGLVGTDLGAAIAAINIQQVKEDSSSLSRGVSDSMSGYIDAMGTLAKLPPAQKPLVGRNMGGLMANITKLNSNIADLNENVVSLTKTYSNLVEISKKSPGDLAAMGGLAPALASMDYLATNDLKNLSKFSEALAGAKNGLQQFQAAGGIANVAKPDGKANQALAKFDKSLHDLSSETAHANGGIGGMLGGSPGSPKAKMDPEQAAGVVDMINKARAKKGLDPINSLDDLGPHPDKNGSTGGTGGGSGGGNGDNGKNAAPGPSSELINPLPATHTEISALIPASEVWIAAQISGPAGDNAPVAHPRPFSGIPLIARLPPAPGSTQVAFSETVAGQNIGVNAYQDLCPETLYGSVCNPAPGFSAGVKGVPVPLLNCGISGVDKAYYNPPNLPGGITAVPPVIYVTSNCIDRRYQDVKILGTVPAISETNTAGTFAGFIPDPATQLLIDLIQLQVDIAGPGDGTQGAMPNVTDNPNGMPHKDTPAQVLVTSYPWLYKDTQANQLITYRGTGNNSEEYIENVATLALPLGLQATDDSDSSNNDNSASVEVTFIQANKQCKPIANTCLSTADYPNYQYWVRMARDACTNQYITPMALNPTFLFTPQWQNDQYPWNESWCQPLILTPVDCMPDLQKDQNGKTCLIDDGEGIDPYTKKALVPATFPTPVISSGNNTNKHVQFDYRAWGYLERAYHDVRNTPYSPAQANSPNILPTYTGGGTPPGTPAGTTSGGWIIPDELNGTQFTAYGQPFNLANPGTATGGGTTTNTTTYSVASINLGSGSSQGNSGSTSSGAGYIVGTWPLYFTGGCGGTGATGTFTVTAGGSGSGVVTSTDITAGGSGYGCAPAVAFTANGSCPADDSDGTPQGCGNVIPGNEDWFAASGNVVLGTPVVKKTKGTSTGYTGALTTINQLIPRNYERIWEPTHPFTPRWDTYPAGNAQPATDRDTYSSKVGPTNPFGFYNGYTQLSTGCEVRCAAVPVDILQFRYPEFNKCISCRIQVNTNCFWDEFWADFADYFVQDSFLAFDPCITYLTPYTIPELIACIIADYAWSYENVVTGSSPSDSQDFGGYCKSALAANSPSLWPPCSTSFDDPLDSNNENGGNQVNTSYNGGNLTCEALSQNNNDDCLKDANDYPDSKKHPSSVSKCCNDLAQAVAPVNTLKIRNVKQDKTLCDQGTTTTGVCKNAGGTGKTPEGYAFQDYFPPNNNDNTDTTNSHMPYMRWWDTGYGYNGVEPPIASLSALNSTGYGPSFPVSGGVNAAWPSNYNPFCPDGQYDVIVGIGIESTDKGSPYGLCRWGGGGGKGYNCLSMGGVDRLTSWYELKQYQMNTTRAFGMTCMAQYEKMYKWLGSEDGALYQAGQHFDSMIPMLNDSTKTLGEAKANRWPLRWRGFLSDATVQTAGATNTRQFPNFDPGTTANAGQFTGLDNAQAGDIIYITNTDAAATAGQIMPFIAVVTAAQHNVNNTTAVCTGHNTCGFGGNDCCDSNDKCNDHIDIVDINNGKYPDACGTTDYIGLGQTRTIYREWLPTNVQEALFANGSTVTDTCNDTHTIVQGVTLNAGTDAAGFCSDPKYASCTLLVPPGGAGATNYWDNIHVYRPYLDERGTSGGGTR